MTKLPILLSIPHGGNKIPPELTHYNNLSFDDIYKDSDPHTIDIYGLQDFKGPLIINDIARCYIDVNRSMDDLPPLNHDGVLKTINLFGKPIYKDNWFPSASLRKLLLEKYYIPFHKQIEKSLDAEIEIALDCHSMLPNPPTFGGIKHNSTTTKRPSICLSNLGDLYGKPVNNSFTSCSVDLLNLLSSGFQKAFEHEDITIKFNSPFKGGYITKHHSMNSEIPWVQIEINRELYMSDNFLDTSSGKTKETRIKDLRTKFKTAIVHLFK
ncbi:N-formylglutamate amidohydrolase [Desulfuribacillus alkaliarsenatis]|uniref:N-formylglutamate amidohydrolase n=1 Tax=Desulfuribacillus alkaliarsenatis TaxID=766136 RepID=A0A1E5FZN2_9FIRM|nr:N-formylglutamate amidohydrolase [Desulfuribacillus alkaliarsenatis]OEF96037.1 hypothetical protein BHF68_09835 [Desulfuribacillus alkaliarsenatis]